MLTVVKRFINRVLESQWAPLMLGVTFYLEGIIMVPADPLLIAMVLNRSDKARQYTLIATIGALLGGLTSYAIGSWLFTTAGESIIHHPWVVRIIRPETFTYLCSQFRTHQWAALLVAAFVPIPYKAITLTAGFCRLPLIPFILCMTLGRAVRYGLTVFLALRFGPRIYQYLDHRYRSMAWLILLLLVSGLLIVKKIWW